jgi:hypothetical protein
VLSHPALDNRLNSEGDNGFARFANYNENAVERLTHHSGLRRFPGTRRCQFAQRVFQFILMASRERKGANMGRDFLYKPVDVIDVDIARAGLKACRDVRLSADIANDSDVHVASIDMKYNIVGLFLLHACEGLTVSPNTGLVQGERPPQKPISDFINNCLQIHLLQNTYKLGVVTEHFL